MIEQSYHAIEIAVKRHVNYFLLSDIVLSVVPKNTHTLLLEVFLGVGTLSSHLFGNFVFWLLRLPPPPGDLH